MKKLLYILLSLSLCVGCSSNNSNTQNGKVDEILTYNIQSFDEVNSIKPLLITNIYNSYVAEDKTNTLYDAIVSIHNTSNEVITIDDTFKGQLTIDNKSYDCNIVSETVLRNNLEVSSVINPSQTKVLHFYSELPKITNEEAKIKLNLKINGKDYNYSFKYHELTKSANELKENEPVTIENVVEATYLSHESTRIIRPSQSVSTYALFQTSYGSTYAAITVKMKNLGTKRINVDQLISVECIGNDEKRFPTTSLIEEESHTSFTYGNITSIDSEQTLDIIYFSEVKLTDINECLEFILSIGGEEYHININK